MEVSITKKDYTVTKVGPEWMYEFKNKDSSFTLSLVHNNLGKLLENSGYIPLKLKSLEFVGSDNNLELWNVCTESGEFMKKVPHTLFSFQLKKIKDGVLEYADCEHSNELHAIIFNNISGIEQDFFTGGVTVSYQYGSYKFIPCPKILPGELKNEWYRQIYNQLVDLI